MPASVAIDTAFLAHALLPRQATADAREALSTLLKTDRSIIASPILFAEFSSVLRKMVNQGRLLPEEAANHFEDLLGLNPQQAPVTEEMTRRAWDIAIQLGQSDTFDAIGYAVAEQSHAEFWTSDRRFANAAERRGLPGVRFVP